VGEPIKVLELNRSDGGGGQGDLRCWSCRKEEVLGDKRGERGLWADATGRGNSWVGKKERIRLDGSPRAVRKNKEGDRKRRRSENQELLQLGKPHPLGPKGEDKKDHLSNPTRKRRDVLVEREKGERNHLG